MDGTGAGQRAFREPGAGGTSSEADAGCSGGNAGDRGGATLYLSPQVAELGRKIVDLPPTDPLNKTFWMFPGIYSGAEVLKILLGVALALRLSVRGKADPDYFVKQFAAREGASKVSGKAV